MGCSPEFRSSWLGLTDEAELAMLGHGRPSSPGALRGCRRFLAEELGRCRLAGFRHPRMCNNYSELKLVAEHVMFLEERLWEREGGCRAPDLDFQQHWGSRAQQWHLQSQGCAPGLWVPLRTHVPGLGAVLSSCRHLGAVNSPAPSSPWG